MAEENRVTQRQNGIQQTNKKDLLAQRLLPNTNSNNSETGMLSLGLAGLAILTLTKKRSSKQVLFDRFLKR